MEFPLAGGPAEQMEAGGLHVVLSTPSLLDLALCGVFPALALEHTPSEQIEHANPSPETRPDPN